MENFPKLISVDDHVIEHGRVWLDRLPAKYHDVGPRTIQERGKMQFVGGVFSYEPSDEGELCDWWLYEDKRVPQTRLSAAAGFAADAAKPEAAAKPAVEQKAEAKPEAAKPAAKPAKVKKAKKAAKKPAAEASKDAAAKPEAAKQ